MHGFLISNTVGRKRKLPGQINSFGTRFLPADGAGGYQKIEFMSVLYQNGAADDKESPGNRLLRRGIGGVNTEGYRSRDKMFPSELLDQGIGVAVAVADGVDVTVGASTRLRERV